MRALRVCQGADSIRLSDSRSELVLDECETACESEHLSGIIV